MKNTGLSFLTAGVFAFGTFVFLSDANAADVTFVAPPAEQNTYHMTYADYTPAQTKAKVRTADSSSSSKYSLKKVSSSSKNFFKKIFSKIKSKKETDSDKPVSSSNNSTPRASSNPEVTVNTTVSTPKTTTPAPAVKTTKTATSKNYSNNPLVQRLKARMAEQAREEQGTPKVVAVSNDKCVTLGNTPRKLFNLTRLLDYSPHPTTENLMQEKPVLFNNKQYWFAVSYVEDWKETNDSAVMTGISFKIDVMENNQKVRALTTPKVTLNKNVKKGQVIGIAEVSPFKFNIKVDSVSTASNGAKELVFSLDIIG